MYSNAVRTDCDVILGLFRALIAACESDSIFKYLMTSSCGLAKVYWHAWLIASISAWNTVDLRHHLYLLNIKNQFIFLKKKFQTYCN